MLKLILILSLGITLSSTADEKVISSSEDTKTLMGTIEFPLDVSKTEAIEIAKFVKKEMAFDQMAVRQISSRRYGIEIRSKYEGGEKSIDSLLEKTKLLVTKKFGKNTIAGWSMSGTIIVIQ